MECTRWQHIRDTFPALVYLYSLMGNIWPPCYLHRGWTFFMDLTCWMRVQPHIIFLVFLNKPIQYHSMYLRILLYRFQINQVYHLAPQTPVRQSFSPLFVSSTYAVGNLIPLTPPNSPLRLRRPFHQAPRRWVAQKQYSFFHILHFNTIKGSAASELKIITAGSWQVPARRQELRGASMELLLRRNGQLL